MWVVVTWELDGESDYPVPTVFGPFSDEGQALRWGTENDNYFRNDWFVKKLINPVDFPPGGLYGVRPEPDR